jgi:hypothetical protein
MRWLILGLLAGCLSAQEPTPVPPTPTVEELQQEVNRLKAELEQVLRIKNLQKEVARVKKALEEERAEKKPQPDDKIPTYKIKPVGLPKIYPGRVMLLRDVNSSWWVIYRRHDSYLLMREFGRGHTQKLYAERWMRENYGSSKTRIPFIRQGTRKKGRTVIGGAGRR